MHRVTTISDLQISWWAWEWGPRSPICKAARAHLSRHRNTSLSPEQTQTPKVAHVMWALPLAWPSQILMGHRHQFIIGILSEDCRTFDASKSECCRFLQGSKRSPHRCLILALNCWWATVFLLHVHSLIRYPTDPSARAWQPMTTTTDTITPPSSPELYSQRWLLLRRRPHPLRRSPLEVDNSRPWKIKQQQGISSLLCFSLVINHTFSSL